MTQPPDDRRPMSWETPDDAPATDQPTVAWTPPADDAAGAPNADAEPAAPPAAPAAPDASPPAEPPVTPPQSPLISASPTPTVAWQTPNAPVVEVAPGLVFAGTAARVVAFIIDSLLIGLIAGIVSSAAGFGAGRSTTLPNGELDYSALFGGVESTIITAVIGGLYFVLSWSGGRRATIGQRIFGIQVGNAFDGAPLTFEQAIRRWLGLGQFLGIFVFSPGLAALASTIQLVWTVALLITTATSPTKQGLHDRFANSALVRPTTAGNGGVFACLVIVILILALGVLGAVMFLTSDELQEILTEIGNSI